MIIIALGNHLLIMKSIYLYFRKRFPIVPLFLFSLITIIGVSKKINTHPNYAKIILFPFIYTGFLFHLRILDEFKDFEYDSKHHPDRPIQRGEISLRQIKILGIINFILMLVAAISASSCSLVPIFFLVIFYSFLMYKEFFIKNFYERAPIYYLISHQIVFIPLYLFFYSSLNGFFWRIDDVNKLALFCYTLIPLVLIEIGRKMSHRFDEHGKKTADTYAHLWGERKTITVFSTLIILAGLFSFFIDNFGLIYSLFLITVGVILFRGGFLFPRQIIKFNMVLTVTFALGLPALLLI